jgi:hypothetical protein
VPLAMGNLPLNCKTSAILYFVAIFSKIYKIYLERKCFYLKSVNVETFSYPTFFERVSKLKVSSFALSKNFTNLNKDVTQ